MALPLPIRVGLSGWLYPPWRGRFYPAGLRQRDELAWAAARVDTIEINGSFYSLQRPESFRRWHDATPDGFRFAVKGPRFVTHMKKLRDVATPLANFFASGVLALDAKLGPLLWQLPPQLGFDAGRIDAFLALLPRDTEAALALARQHDERLAGRSWLRIDRRRPQRHALEIRHPSFETPDFVRLLRRHRVALVVADSVAWPCREDVTADFVYVRLHGSRQLYASGYGPRAMMFWTARARAWAAGSEPADARKIAPLAPPHRAARPVFVYFDNDAKVKAPRDARRLMAQLAAVR